MSLDAEKSVYLLGIHEFNRGRFFEAHEVWEDAWNGTSGRRSDFYRGLIQMSVALEHYRRLNALGVQKVFASALELWAGLPDRYMGLDLRGFEERMRRALALPLAAAPGSLRSVDTSGFFQIGWAYDPFESPLIESED